MLLPCFTYWSFWRDLNSVSKDFTKVKKWTSIYCITTTTDSSLCIYPRGIQQETSEPKVKLQRNITKNFFKSGAVGERCCLKCFFWCHEGTNKGPDELMKWDRGWLFQFHLRANWEDCFKARVKMKRRSATSYLCFCWLIHSRVTRGSPGKRHPAALSILHRITCLQLFFDSGTRKSEQTANTQQEAETGNASKLQINTIR